jgi:aminotransferase
MPDSILERIGIKSRTKNMSQRVKNISVSAIKEMVIAASQMKDVISFAWGVPPFKPAEFVRKQICQQLLDDPEIGKYSPMAGQPRLKEALAKKLKKQKKISLDAEKEILVTCGTMEAIKITMEAIIDPGDEVILFSPTFPSHRDQIILSGGIPVYVPLIEEQNWQADINYLEKAITKKTKAILITSPNNPTGTVLTKNDLENIAMLAEKYDLFVISDETYDFLTFGKIKHTSAITMPQFRDRFIICYSCSKEYTMSGWRVGFVCADSGIIQQLQKVHDATVVCAPTVSQLAATLAIEGPQDYIKEHCAIYEQRLELTCQRLDKLSHIFEYQKPQGTYYIFPRIKNSTEIDDVKFCLDVLEHAKVVLVPGSAFGPTGKGHIRIVFAAEEHTLIEGFDRLDQYFKRHSKY